MDLLKLISDIEQVDPEVYERLDSRRRVFRHVSGMGKTLGAAALPGFMSMLFNKAYGQGSATTLPAPVADVLNLALQLEYLEYHFYAIGLGSGTLISAADRPAITAIRNDESGHVKVLRGALRTQAFSASDPTAAAFDYTAGNRFNAVFSNAAMFYAVAQSFEDLGVRAYKGAAPKLLANKTLVETAFRIHSVEARHASHIRTLRRGKAAGVEGPAAAQTPALASNLAERPKSWVSETDSGGPAAPFTAPIYGAGTPAVGVASQIYFPAEDNYIQNGATTLTGSAATPEIDSSAASEAFDEGLNENKVKDIALFFRSAQGAALGLFQ
ncbi:hypothetical protein GCM10023185_41160 [Hymenobacter saemangeumensis]|uniref:Ferritin-like domain-containing protein n=1 Tax=Hymenobacter saemangeumensis TaxID=1084522 RepID=A0ABP8IS58_9BACT